MSLSWFNRQGRGRQVNRSATAKKRRPLSIQLHDLEDRTTPANGTFQFDPLQTVSFSEGAGTAQLKVLLVTNNAPLLGTVTVNIDLAGGSTATAGSDFTNPFPTSVTFNETDPHPPNGAGELVYTKIINVPILNNTIVEGNETINFQITGFSQTDVNSISFGAPSTLTYTIVDNDTTTVSITPASVSENVSTGGTSDGNLSFNVTMTNQIDIDLPVNVAYSGGTATGSGTDYDSATDAANIVAGTLTSAAPVTVAINNDTVLEATETFLASLSTALALNGRQVTFVAPQTMSITDNETAVVSIVANTTPVNEVSPGNTNIVPATLTITANGVPNTGTTGVALTANLSTSTPLGTGVDYTTTATTFAAGTASGVSQNIGVTGLDDAVTERFNEDFNTTLVSAPNGTSTTFTGTQVIRVVDNETTNFTINSGSVTETNAVGQTLTLNVSLSNPLDVPATINVGFINGTTEAGDYTSTPILVTFPANSTASQAVVIPITGDLIVETATETFRTNMALDGSTPLTGYTNVTVTNPGADNATINDNDTATFTIANVSVAENVAGGNLPFVLKLSNPIEVATTVNVNFVDLTATGGGTDYTSSQIQVSFPALDNADKPVNVPINNDGIAEPTETFRATLALDPSEPLNTYSKNITTSASNAAIGTITDNDQVIFTFTADPTVNETAGTIPFTVTNSAQVSVDTTVQINFTDISTETGDFAHFAQTVTFLSTDPAGTTKTVNVTVNNDNIVEPTETFTASLDVLTDLGGLGIAFDDTDTATGTITDNDVAAYTVSTASYNEAAGTVTLTVTLSNPVDVETKINVNYGGGNATGGGTDYDSATDQVTFAAGTNTPQTVTVAINDDSIVELDETFVATPSLDGSTPLTGYNLPTFTAGTETILDNDIAVFTINDVSAAENSGNLQFTLNLDKALSTNALVNVSFGTPGTATAGTDYTATTIQVPIAAGASGNFPVNVPLTGDTIVERNETFTATLALDGTTPLTGYQKDLTDTGVGTITNDDTAIFSINNQTLAEGVAPGFMTFTITLDKTVDTAVTLNTVYGGGSSTATGGADYDATTDQITFPANSVPGFTQTVTVGIVDDAVVEAPETFLATLGLDGSTPLTGGYLTNLATPVQGTGTINSLNDTATIGLAAASSSATEGSSASIGATLTITSVGTGTPMLGSAVTVHLATASTDVTLPTAPAYTFPAGALSGTVPASVLATNDVIVEPQETASLSLTSLSTVLNTPTTLVSLVGGPNVMTISDNDSATVSIASGTTTITEGQAGVALPVTLAFVTSGTGTPTLGVDVTVALTPGDADFTSNTVAFLAGDTAATARSLTITAVNDARIEASPETIVGGRTLVITGITPGPVAPATIPAAVTVSGTSGTRTISVVDNDSATLTYGSVSGLTIGLTEVTPLPVIPQNVPVTIAFVTNSTPGLPGNLSTPGLDVEVSASIGSITNDFTATTILWGIDEAVSTKNVEVQPIDDRLVEQTTEALSASLETTTLAAVNEVGFVNVNVTDNDTATVAITTGSTSLTEGAGTANITATLTLATTGTTALATAALATPITVQMSAANSGNADYTTVTPATFAVGAPSGQTQPIVVQAVNDLIVEGTETFTTQVATATSLTAVAAPTGSQTVTVTDNDTAQVLVNDVTVNEFAGTMQFSLTLSNPINGNAAINVTFSNGPTNTATAGTDYTNTLQTITIPANTVGPVTFNVPIATDAIAELNETFTVNLALNTTLTPLAGFSINTTDTGIGTITDDDAVVFTITDVTVNESAGNAVFNVSSNKALDIPIGITYNFGGGTAIGGLDYNSSTQTLTYTAGSTSTTVTVPIFPENLVELNETFNVTMSTTTPLGSRVVNLTDTAVGTITDDDLAVFSVSSVTVNEGAGTATFTVSPDNPIDTPIDIVVGYAGGTATGGDVDYDSLSDTVTFLAGSTTPKTVTVAITEDNIAELAETFNVTLTSPTALTGRDVGDVTFTGGVGTITDNDVATFTIGDVIVNEGDTATFTITLDKPLSTATTVNVNYTDQSATGGNSDYDSTSDSVGFAIGESGSKTVTVATTGDFVNEPIETFLASLNVTGTTGQSVVFSDTATGTIIDHNEAPVVTAPGAQNFLANTPITILGISVTDDEVVLLNANVEVTLGVTNGGLTLATTAGLTFSAGDGSGDDTMTFQGTLAAVNAALASLVYTPTTDTLADDTIEISVDDLGSLGAGGPMVTTETIDLVAPQGLAQVQVNPLTPGLNDLVVYGNPGNDTITVTPAPKKSFKVTVNNVVVGTFNGVKGRIVVFGGDGNDSIIVSSKVGRSNYLDGGTGNDTLTGGKAKDTLTGGAGNDILDGGKGKDTVYDKGDANFTLTGGTRTTDGSLVGLGTDVLVKNRIEYAYLVGGASANTLNTTAFNGNVTLMGGAGDDTLTSGAKNDVLVGGEGADNLNAGAGRDLLIGGNGLDVLNGGDQDDILVGSSTIYDTDAASLGLIMKTWTSSTKTFTVRKNFINGVNTKNPPNKTVVLRATTVFTDTINDSFTGGNGRDYFVNFLGENVLDNGTGGADELANLVTT